MKQNKLSLFLMTLASGFLLCQNAGAFGGGTGIGYPTFQEEFWYNATGRLGDAATGGGNLWTGAQNSIVVTNDPTIIAPANGSLDGTTNGLVASYGDRCVIYPTNDYNNAPYEKWGNSGQYNPGTSELIHKRAPIFIFRSCTSSMILARRLIPWDNGLCS